MTLLALLFAVAGETITADVAVIGGGSAGFAAAWTAATLGSEVVLVEKEASLGGTSTTAGVCNWEPGVGCTGVPYRVYQRLRDRPGACGVYEFVRHGWWERKRPPDRRFPGALLAVNPLLDYADTFCGHGPDLKNEAWYRAYCHGLVFDPAAMASTMAEMLRETGRCRVLTGVAFEKAEPGADRLEGIVLSDGRRVRAKVFVDATDGALCRQLGCEMMSGPESRDVFGEPDAPERAGSALNGVTLMFSVTPKGAPGVDPLPPGIPADCWWGKFPDVFALTLPNGDIWVNMLPTMKGEEAFRLGPAAALAECRRRVSAQWHWLQTVSAEFRACRMKSVAPVLAYRETVRVRGEHVLTQNDLIAGLSGPCFGERIAVADHSIDGHGAGIENRQVHEPYGIPYGCLLPVGTKNVLIAGRAASFSSIAASSCRLSRTMMQLGEAAGAAAHLAVSRCVPLRQIAAADIRAVMAARIDGNPVAEERGSGRHPVRIVAFGDSITQAIIGIPYGENWLCRLQRRLGDGYATFNAGIGGNSAREAMARFESDVLSRRPDVVLIEFGGNNNDFRNPDRRVDDAEFLGHLRRFRDGLPKSCKVVAITFPPIKDEWHRRYVGSPANYWGDEALDSQRQIVRDFARENGWPLVDLHEIMKDRRTDLLQPDGVHLNAEGQRVFADAVYNVLLDSHLKPNSRTNGGT